MFNEPEIEKIRGKIHKSRIKRKAVDRVKSYLLVPCKDILIDYDWDNYDEHIKWVAEAPLYEILDWCKILRGYIEYNILRGISLVP